MKIAIVGCGAVTELRHLPALGLRPGYHAEVLVDPDLDRARALAGKFTVPRVLADCTDLGSVDVEGAIVAAPNHLHGRITEQLLEAGIHVLVEKPMAPTTAECARMIAVARDNDRVLAVGMMRRFLRSGRFVRWAVESGRLGRIESVDIREGRVFNWPVTSAGFFRQETMGGGVLMDTGVHTLDQLIWWLGGVEDFEYFDNNDGGVESDCEIHLRMRSGATGVVELSRTRNLRDTAVIRGERGEMEVALSKNHLVWRPAGAPYALSGSGVASRPLGTVDQSQLDIVADEHADWIEAIRTGRPPETRAEDAKERIALIEACYRRRQPLDLPWNISSGRSATNVAGR
jgi:predicted dehydrogenase